MKSINSNSVAIAGEFAVLSQLTIHGYDANITLGNTKSVDILASNQKTGKLYKIEVKTNLKDTRSNPSVSRIFGSSVSEWMLSKKNEKVNESNLFYCFVNITRNTNEFKFYIVPSKVVAQYVKDEHQLWLSEKKKEGKIVKDADMRTFRLGVSVEKYKIKTPIAEKYENNWDMN